MGNEVKERVTKTGMEGNEGYCPLHMSAKEAMLRIKLMNHQKRMIEFYIENAGTEYLTEEGNRWREKLNGRLTEIVRKNKEGNNEAQ